MSGQGLSEREAMMIINFKNSIYFSTGSSLRKTLQLRTQGSLSL